MFTTHSINKGKSIMTYYESAEGVKVSLARAIKEYQDHGFTAENLEQDLGSKAEYDAQQLLKALGY